MLLSDIFTYLSYGELSQFELGTSNNGSITEADYPRITTFVNRGLIQLHSKLPLRLEQVLLQVDPLRPRYTLHSKHSVGSGGNDQDPKYILDTTNPFQNNLIKVEQVFRDDGCEFSLNELADKDTVFTPLANVVQFSIPYSGKASIIYRANHPLLDSARGTDPSTVEVSIVDTLLEPLLAFVAAKVLSAKGGKDGVQEGMLLTQSFNMQLEELKAQGVFVIDNARRERIWSDQWV
jgi:hypothetical protein